jgi:dihydrodipicolinate synthase/N-acetylneuraminate lyase
VAQLLGCGALPMPPDTTSAVARGVYAALLTPRRPGTIEADAAAMLDYLDNLARAGVDGLVLFGSTGEFVHFPPEERMRTAGLAIRRSRLPVIVNVSHSCLDGCILLAEHALEGGAAGILLMPPYYFKYSDGQIFEFYSRFAECWAAKLPLYAYNIPVFTNPISPSLMERLLLAGWFAGAKDSSGSAELFEVLMTVKAANGLQVLVGNDAKYREAMAAGADGVVSGVAAAIPELLVGLHQAARSNNQAKAERLHADLIEFIGWVDKFPATMAIHHAANLRQWKVGAQLMPLDAAGAETLLAFEAWFKNWLPLVLDHARMD